MEGKPFLGQYLILVMILLLRQIHGYRSCIEKERVALLDIKKYTIASNESDHFLTTWTNATKSDCCQWEKVKCDRASGRVIRLSIGWAHYRESSLNLSLLHPFEEIQILDLSWSGFSGLFDDVEGFKSLRRLRNLEILDLSQNAFNNTIFPFINAATSLTTLILSWNYMDGLFPAIELKDLPNLELLDLSENRFNNSIPLGDLPALRNLKALDLHGNEFSTSVQLQGIFELKNLEELNLSQNKLVGQFPLCLPSFTGLRVLDLSSNQLNEKLPSAIRNLESLEYMSLSNNSFEGSFSLGLLAKLSKLRVFRLDSKGNSLQVESGSSWKPKFQLNVIALPSCNLKSFEGTLPSSLGNMRSIEYLDLSHNRFHGKLPRAFVEGCYSLVILKLSYNKLSGEIFHESVSFTGVYALFLDNNHFTGEIGHGLRRLQINLSLLDISNNNLTGVIPSWIGELPVFALLLSNNSLEGQIPSQLCSLTSIRLMDLANNRDSISTRDEGTYFKSMLILDQFTRDEYHVRTQTKIEFATKDRFDAYMGGNLGYLFGMDLSENELSGEIPVELGGLKEFHALNLSHNSLSGAIPESFSGLKSMESLDLSYNRLQGRIPPELAELSSLAVFNVSYNNLLGAIPLGRQFNTFDTQSYLGNPLLCGKPTNISCQSNNFQEADDGVESDESTINMESFYWSLVSAYVTILIGIFASFSFNSPWSRFWFFIVDAFIDKVRIWLW
ncbi:Leucine-rich repeat-containing protein [Hirschfeldia incana]|nr:Leucine-rich repeat-containing protein [Hirschfeldia incana]